MKMYPCSIITRNGMDLKKCRISPMMRKQEPLLLLLHIFLLLYWFMYQTGMHSLSPQCHRNDLKTEM